MSDHTPRLLDAMDAFEDGVYIISEDYVVEYMNRFMKKLFGDGVGKKMSYGLKRFRSALSMVPAQRSLQKQPAP